MKYSGVFRNSNGQKPKFTKQENKNGGGQPQKGPVDNKAKPKKTPASAVGQKEEVVVSSRLTTASVVVKGKLTDNIL